MIDNAVVANLDYSVGDGIDYLIIVRAEQHVALEIRKSVVDGGYGLEVEVVRRLIENEDIRAEEHHAREHASDLFAAGEDIDGLQNCVARKQHSAEEAADISLRLIL